MFFKETKMTDQLWFHLTWSFKRLTLFTPAIYFVKV